MKVIGITGKIATGKSFVAEYLKKTHGFSVFNADKNIHELYRTDQGIIRAIATEFPHAVVNGMVDREILANYVIQSTEKLDLLSHITHPSIRYLCAKFIKDNRAKHSRIVVLDIPLLFDINAHVYCDCIIYLKINRIVQHTRLYTKHQHNTALLQVILKHQKDYSKRCDYIINTGLSKYETIIQINELLLKALK